MKLKPLFFISILLLKTIYTNASYVDLYGGRQIEQAPYRQVGTVGAPSNVYTPRGGDPLNVYTNRSAKSIYSNRLTGTDRALYRGSPVQPAPGQSISAGRPILYIQPNKSYDTRPYSKEGSIAYEIYENRNPVPDYE